MANRDAFTEVPQGTTFTVFDNHFPEDFEPASGTTVLGCGRLNCVGCDGLRKKAIQNNAKFISTHIPGAIATFRPGHTLLVEAIPRAKKVERERLDQDVKENTLCKSCKSVDFSKLLLDKNTDKTFFPTYKELIDSSQRCPLCALFASSLIDPSSFHPDDSRAIILKGTDDGNTIGIVFPSKEEGFDEFISERYATLNVWADTDGSEANIPAQITGRLPHNPADVKRIKTWLSDCRDNHTKCKQARKSHPDLKRPRRLVHVGTADGTDPPRLEDDQNYDEEYVTLSHRWGDPSKVIQTKTENLAEFQKALPMETLSSLFQDAIKLTRLLGFKYVWIDSLCIIQNDLSDKASEVVQMAAIYQGSSLTLSASASTATEVHLITDREHSSLVSLPIGDSKTNNGLSLYVSDQDLHTFQDDVIRGALGSRGWCFQERLLAPRLLHFGQDQLHWECHEGIWSESSTKRIWYDNLNMADDGRLRPTLQSAIAEPAITVDLEGFGEVSDLIDEGLSKALASLPTPSDAVKKQRRSMYDAWYQAVAAYTFRELTVFYDKLPALAGAAVQFNTVINDTYIAGLWSNDLPQGLLWSRRAFELVHVDPAIAIRPGIGGRGESTGNAEKYWRGAPSWSWASVEGSVHWVTNRNGPVHIGPFAFLTKPGGNAYSGLEWGAIRIRGQLLEAQKLSWIRNEARKPECRSDFEKWIAAGPIAIHPQLDPDDPGWEKQLEEAGMSGPLYFLLICSIPLTPAPGVKVDKDKPECLLGYALMLRFWRPEGAFRRVGIAKVALMDFLNVAQDEIHIF